MNVPAH